MKDDSAIKYIYKISGRKYLSLFLGDFEFFKRSNVILDIEEKARIILARFIDERCD